MKSKLIPFKFCDQPQAKSATKCPHCGKGFTSLPRLLAFAVVGLILAWFLFGRGLLQTVFYGKRIDQIEETLRRNQQP